MKTLILFMTLLVSQFSLAQEKVYVQNKATYVEDAAVRDSVKDNCDIDEALGDKVYKRILVSTPNAIAFSSDLPPAAAAIVTLSILSVHGNGGASVYTGGKSMTVRADYKVAGQIVATKTIITSSRGGFFGGYSGICSVLRKDADDIAKKIGIWFQDTRAQQKADLDKPAAGVSENIVYLNLPIEFLNGDKKRVAIDDECALTSITEAYLLEQANREGVSMKTTASNKAEGMAMRVSFVDAVGADQVQPAEEKPFTMHVDLLKDGNVVSSKDFERKSKRQLEQRACGVFEKFIRVYAGQSMKWAIEELSIETGPKLSKKGRVIRKPESKEVASGSNADAKD